MNRTEELVYWITEREEMRKRRELRAACAAGGRIIEKKYGHSDNPHMGLVRYCNVRREDDKVTRWLAQHWRPQHHAVWATVLARMVNYIPTLVELLDQAVFLYQDPLAQGVAPVMKQLREDGHKIWTSAYTISTAGQSMDKVDYVMGVVGAVRSLEESKWLPTMFDNLSTCHHALTAVNGLGSFLAAQVVADLKNTQGHPLQHAPDWHAWSAHGPGSLKGLSEYFHASVTPRLYRKHIAVCWDEVKPMLPLALQDLHMQDFQNCLCEFSKFMRVKRGGHVRNKYAA